MHKVVREVVTYKNHKECIRLNNGVVDIVVTVSEGPRIIRYGFTGMQNEFCDDAQMTMSVNDGEWRLMGGHRLLHSPEEFPRTYEPDNEAVRWEKIQNGVRVLYEQNRIANITKEMEITLFPEKTKVQVLHRLINKNAWAVKTGPWACTVMAKGGTVIIPFNSRKAHFKNGAADARYATFWSYTDTGDSRVKWGSKYIAVGYDPEVKDNLKLGFSNKAGWCGYIHQDHLFIVRAEYIENAKYPDNGCSCEVFACDFMSEIETLAPYKILAPGEESVHTEQWEIHENVRITSMEDIEIDKAVRQYI